MASLWPHSESIFEKFYNFENFGAKDLSYSHILAKFYTQLVDSPEIMICAHDLYDKFAGLRVALKTSIIR